MSKSKRGSESSSESQKRPRRAKNEAHRCYLDSDAEGNSLEVDGVMKVLRRYEESDGGINCCVCGKLYKSKVCLTKHLWEHSVYWDLFEGAKNHERVLSIQAAIILYTGFHEKEETPEMDHLLVTSPHEKKQKSPEKTSNSPNDQLKTPQKRKSKKSLVPCRKRIRLDSGSDSGISSSSDIEYAVPNHHSKTDAGITGC